MTISIQSKKRSALSGLRLVSFTSPPQHIRQLTLDRELDAFFAVAPADVVLHRCRGMFEEEDAVF